MDSNVSNERMMKYQSSKLSSLKDKKIFDNNLSKKAYNEARYKLIIIIIH